MSRLIFFSGGVESTALLGMAQPNDVLVTMNVFSNRYIATYHKQEAEWIASKYGHNINYVNILLPDVNEQWNINHLIASIVSVAHLWVVKDQSITAVWSGRNLEEAPGPKDFRISQQQAWAFMHPSVPWERPLEHMPKKDQWMLIPDIVKPKVRSCINHSACGTCTKCVEFNRMLSSQ